MDTTKILRVQRKDADDIFGVLVQETPYFITIKKHVIFKDDRGIKATYNTSILKHDIKAVTDDGEAYMKANRDKLAQNVLEKA